jgi:hypothetical protein
MSLNDLTRQLAALHAESEDEAELISADIVRRFRLPAKLALTPPERIDVLESLQDLALYDLLTSATHNAEEWRLRLPIDAERRLRNAAIKRLVSNLEDPRPAPPVEGPHYMEESAPETRLCDEAYLNLRRLKNFEESKNAYYFNTEDFLELAQAKRDEEITMAARVGGFTAFVDDSVLFDEREKALMGTAMEPPKFVAHERDPELAALRKQLAELKDKARVKKFFDALASDASAYPEHVVRTWLQDTSSGAARYLLVLGILEEAVIGALLAAPWPLPPDKEVWLLRTITEEIVTVQEYIAHLLQAWLIRTDLATAASRLPLYGDGPRRLCDYAFVLTHRFFAVAPTLSPKDFINRDEPFRDAQIAAVIRSPLWTHFE